MRASYILILSCGLALAACSKSSDDKATTQTTNATATGTVAAPAATAATATVTAAVAPTASAPAAGNVDVSPDMKAFMAMLDGKDKSAGNALKKYAVPAMQHDDLGMYTLTDPKVTASDKSGAMQCYTMVSTAGVMTHTTHVCWNAKGKIAQISDTSS